MGRAIMRQPSHWRGTPHVGKEISPCMNMPQISNFWSQLSIFLIFRRNACRIRTTTHQFNAGGHTFQRFPVFDITIACDRLPLLLGPTSLFPIAMDIEKPIQKGISARGADHLELVTKLKAIDINEIICHLQSIGLIGKVTHRQVVQPKDLRPEE